MEEQNKGFSFENQQNDSNEAEKAGAPAEQMPSEASASVWYSGAQPPIEQPAAPPISEGSFGQPAAQPPQQYEQPAEQQSQRYEQSAEQPPLQYEQPAEQSFQQAAGNGGAEQYGASYQESAQPMDQIPAQQNFYQGSYSYQNPNPYQNYQWQMPPQPVKKNRNRPFIIAAIIAGAIMMLCCIIVVFAEFADADFLDGKLPDSGYFGDPSEEKDEPEKNDEETAKREDDVDYNAPDISTEKKKGEAMSLVDINKKMKDSVVGVLIAPKKDAEVVFSGSGFIISEDGYIITNEHVVSKAKKVRVVLSDGITEYDAVIVGKDEQADLAILKVEAKGLTAAELGDSDELEVGETVAAIGNPFGLELAGSMTDGIISALDRKIEIKGSFMTLIQTNASINPGNSGGPLVNAYGQVIGICSSKLVADGYEGIGFAIPINDAADLSEELINYGHIRSRGYIGIMGQDLSEEYCEYHGIPQGVYVSYVDPESAAAKKGMKEGDIIIGLNGEDLESMAELNELKNRFRPGDEVTVKVWRNKKEIEFKIVLSESTED